MDRRTFLETAGAAPALRLMGESAAPVPHDEGKFTPLDLARYFNASPAEFGPRQQASSFSEDRLVHTLSGKQQLRGIPFLLGNSEARTKCWVMLSAPAKPWSSQAVEIPVGRKGSYLCLAQFCDWEDPVRDADRPTPAGQVLANAVLVYEDGTRATLPVRRRLEVCAPTTDWGLRALLALAHPQMETVNLNSSLNRALEWGRLQTVVVEDGNAPLMWICALQNPHPDRTIRTLRMEAAVAEPLALCGATVYHGKENPLRYDRLMVYRIALPEARAGEADRWHVSVDLGVVARQYALPSFDGGAWVASDGAGLGGPPAPVTGGRYLYAEVTASPDATLALHDKTAGKVYLFDLAKAAPGQDVAARAGEARVRLIERDKVWVRARVTDAASGRAVPVRVAFRSAEGRYIPPYGHRTEINMGWFQDYGGDVKMGADSFAYVDGEFQVELPVGEVYVEANKGFEYAPVRKRLDIRPDQRELRIEMSKHADLRAQGWVSADTHVHFISPSTAILEGQAEGLNLINLLAAQWGDLYTNVGDLPHGPLVSRDREMVVWPGTENRHHLMGHIGLLGTKGDPVFPLSGGFPYGNDEAFPGDPLWMSMAEWADTCRAREGLAVAVHFPYPLAELAADIVLGKIDAIEIGSGRSQFDSLPYMEWYRYLNCGYRLPVAGGTDKMGANMAVGRSRTYAFIGQEEFSFSNWAKAVRKGNTFVTTGPLLLMRVDGRAPGEEIALGAGGGTVEVEARVRSFTPVHRVEIVVNGKVAAVKEEKQGAREMVFRDKVPVRAPGWIAARCTSQPGAGARWPSVFAHTSAVYLTAPGRELFSAPIAAYMLTLIDGTQKWVETIATRADPERYERIRKVLTDARAELERRMKKG